MTSPADAWLSRLRHHRLLAIVRAPDAESAHTAAATLLDAGVELLEVSLTTPGALEVIRRLTAGAADDGPRAVGAGTVLTAAQAERARDAGASFLVTPALSPALERGADLGLPVLAGAATPSEVVEAGARGATAVKLFPAGHWGGPAYLRALREPLPDVPFVPVGGVDADSVPAYLAAGAVAVGVGSPLLGDAVRGGDLRDLRERAARFLDAVREHG